MQIRARSATLGMKLDRRHSVPTVSVQTVGILKRSGRSNPADFPGLTEPGMLPQEMAAAVPMPSEPELNLMFSQLVVCVATGRGSPYIYCLWEDITGDLVWTGLAI